MSLGLFKKKDTLEKRIGFRNGISKIVYGGLSDWLIRLSKHSTILFLSLVDVIEWNLKNVSIQEVIESWPEKPSSFQNEEDLVSQLKNGDSPYLRSLIHSDDHRFQLLWGVVLEYYLFTLPSLIKFYGGLGKSTDPKGKIGANKEDLKRIIFTTSAYFLKQSPLNADFMNDAVVGRMVENIYRLQSYKTVEDWESKLFDNSYGHWLTETPRLDNISPNPHIINSNSYYSIYTILCFFYDFISQSKNTAYLIQQILNSPPLNSLLWRYLTLEYKDIMFNPLGSWAFLGCYDGYPTGYDSLQELFWENIKQELEKRGYEFT